MLIKAPPLTDAINTEVPKPNWAIWFTTLYENIKSLQTLTIEDPDETGSAGSYGQVIFNKDGVLTGDNFFKWDDVAKLLYIGSLTENMQVWTDENKNLISKTDEGFEDLRFPATVINPPGQVADPDWDIVNGGWLFAASGTELIYVIAQMPHSWKEGSPIEPHVHWQKTTSAAGNVLWRLEYKWAPINAVMDPAFTTIDVSEVVSDVMDTDTDDKHLISSFGYIDATGKKISDVLVMRVSRIGGDADDTYGADARLLEFDIHHQINSRGSTFQYVK